MRGRAPAWTEAVTWAGQSSTLACPFVAVPAMLRMWAPGSALDGMVNEMGWGSLTTVPWPTCTGSLWKISV